MADRHARVFGAVALSPAMMFMAACSNGAADSGGPGISRGTVGAWVKDPEGNVLAIGNG
jgi:hypothetical protein